MARSRAATPPPSFERVRRRPPALLLGGASAAALAALGVATGLVPFSRLAPVASPGPAAGSVAAATGSAAPASGIVLAAAPAASLPSPARLRVRILSVPGGAEVFEGGARVGATPFDVELETGSEVEYRFVRPGYRALARRVEASEGVVEVRLSKSALRGSPRSRRELGERAEGEENPYGKVDDLKPDPFLEDPKPDPLQ